MLTRHPTTSRRTSQRGFTLLELLVTILVIAVLAGVTVPVYRATIGELVDNTTELRLRTLARGVAASAAIGSGFDFVADDDLGAVLTENGGAAPSRQTGTVSLSLASSGRAAAMAVKSGSGRCVYMTVIGESVVSSTRSAERQDECSPTLPDGFEAEDLPGSWGSGGDDVGPNDGRPVLLASGAHVDGQQLASSSAVEPGSLDISSDGLWWAFASVGTNLKELPSIVGDPGDPRTSIFVAGDAGQLLRADVNADGEAGNDSADRPRISADGCRTVFRSAATNLDPTVTSYTGTGDPAAFNAVLRDRCQNTTQVLTVNGSDAVGGVVDVAISAAGDRVVVTTTADLIDGVSNDGAADVYVVVVGAGTCNPDAADAKVCLLSVTSAGDTVTVGGTAEAYASISPNARFVAFHTLKALDPDDTNGQQDVYRIDLTVGPSSLRLMSRPEEGSVGDGRSFLPDVSDDGTVAFRTTAENLGAPAGVRATVVATAGSLSRIPGSSGVDSAGPAISRDGRFVAYPTANATDGFALDPSPSVWRFDRSGNTASPAALTSAPADGESVGAPLSEASLWPAMSGDGSRVGYLTTAQPFNSEQYGCVRNGYMMDFTERFSFDEVNVSVPGCSEGDPSD